MIKYSLYILIGISMITIFWAMAGYALSLRFISIFYKKRINSKINHTPTVTLMIVAHNEEKVIDSKIQNALKLDYPESKFEILIASDNSSDKTNEIVSKYVKQDTKFDIRLFEVKQRKGKTNAQNEAQKTIKSDIIVMTDANSMLDKNAIKELVSSFSSDNIGYVCGKLTYINEENTVAGSENNYWEKELQIREIESRIATITAGNGAIYACRNSLYQDVNIIESHDSAMPRYMALNKNRSIYNPDAIAYEKAGENIGDEYNRKVRMNRGIIKAILPSLKLLNIFKYGWYTYFYLGHRSSRYLLWLMHLNLLICSGILSIIGDYSYIFIVLFSGQVLFYLIALITHIFKIKNKYFNLVYYYTITIVAQFHGVLNIITGKAKPFWEKAESTR